MTDKKPPKPPFNNRNNNNTNVSRRLDFLTDEENAPQLPFEALRSIALSVMHTAQVFLEIGSKSLRNSLKYGLPIDFAGSIAASFIHHRIADTSLQTSSRHTDDMETVTADYHTPSNPRQRTILQKNPLTLELTRFTFNLPDESERDPEEGVPEAGFTYTTADGRTFVGSPQLGATHADSIEVTPGVDDKTPERERRAEAETPGAPIAPHRRASEDDDDSVAKPLNFDSDSEDDDGGLTNADTENTYSNDRDVATDLFDAFNDASTNNIPTGNDVDLLDAFNEASTRANAAASEVASSLVDEAESALSGSDNDEDDIM